MMQQVTPKISEIKKLPTTWDDSHQKIHESIFKAHATLQLIMEMVNRGDSKETIWNVYDEIYNGEEAQKIIISGSDTSSITIPIDDVPGNIRELDLPFWIINRLIDGEIKTKDDLIQLGWNDIMKIRGIGKKSTGMIIKVIEAIIEND